MSEARDLLQASSNISHAAMDLKYALEEFRFHVGQMHNAARMEALVIASRARIEGMVAENQHRTSCGDSIAYDADAFFAEASSLEASILNLVNS